MKKTLLLAVTLCIAVCMAWAQPAAPGQPLKNDSSVRVGKLDNGLTYYIKHNNKPEKRAEFFLFTNVGAIQETPAQNGLAHFLEHMALNGTKNLPGKAIISYFERIGARFGENINASTGVEQTSYMLNNIPVIRPGIIDTALLVMHDYSHFVSNDLAEIEKERPVIMEELRTRNTADQRLHEASLPVMYKDSKYATCNIGGTIEGIASFAPQELTDFYKTWYRPDLQAVVVVGDIDVDQVEAKIKTLFADIPKPGTPNPKVMFPVPDNKAPLVSIATDPEASGTSVSILYKYEPLPRENKSLGMSYLIDMVKSFATSMLNERYNEMTQKPNAPFVDAGAGFYSICEPVDALYASADAKEGNGLIAFEAMLKELQRVDNFGFTESELARAKTNYMRRLERMAQNAADRKNQEFVYEYIRNFSDNEPYMTPEYEMEVAKGYMPFIQLAQINQMMQEALADENIVVMFASPKKDGLAVPVEKDFLAVMAAVKVGTLEPYAEQVSSEPLVDASKIKAGAVVKEEAGMFGSTVWTLSNGVRVILKPTELKKDEVIFSAFKEGGYSTVASEDLLPIISGVYSMYAGMAGVAGFPAVELNKKLTGKIASMSPMISAYSQGFRGAASPQDIETMLQLLYLKMVSPRLEEAEFAPVMAQLNAYISNAAKQPNFLIQKEMNQVMYGGNARRPMLTPENISQINFKSIEKVYRNLLCAADGMTMLITGSIQPNDIKPLVEKYIASLPVKGQSPAWKDEGVYFPKGKIEHPFEVTMETPKTTVVQMYHGEMPYTLENTVMMAVLTQVMDLIYTQTIREEAGGTYGVLTGGSLSLRPNKIYQTYIQFDTELEKSAQLIQLAKDGLNGIAQSGPTEEQLQKTLENMLKKRQEAVINNAFWSGILVQYYQDNYDMHTDYETVVKGVTADKVKAFTKQLLSQNFIELVMNPKK